MMAKVVSPVTSIIDYSDCAVNMPAKYIADWQDVRDLSKVRSRCDTAMRIGPQSEPTGYWKLSFLLNDASNCFPRLSGWLAKQSNPTTPYVLTKCGEWWHRHRQGRTLNLHDLKPYAHLNLQRELCGERQRNERQRAKRPDRLTYALINMLDLCSARFVIIKTYKS